MPDISQVIPIAVSLILLGILLTQCRKPWGPAGRFYLWLMNISHSKLTDWGLDYIAVEKEDTILDVGCGGGKTVEKLAGKASDGKVFGIDYSKSSVAAAKAWNKHSISAGKVEIAHGSVSNLPYPDDKFDIVTAIETHYYWPDPVSDMREILRVLKPGGRLIIIAETYKGRASLDWLYQGSMALLGGSSLTIDEHTAAFRSAGFSEIETHTESKKGWISCVGNKAWRMVPTDAGE